MKNKRAKMRKPFPQHNKKRCKNCGAMIRDYNKSGYCHQCYRKVFLKRNTNRCKVCGKVITSYNKSGYCSGCHKDFIRGKICQRKKYERKLVRRGAFYQCYICKKQIDKIGMKNNKYLCRECIKRIREALD